MTTETTTLTDQIRARLDDWDAEHDTTDCPGVPGCIHTAVAGLRAVLDLADRGDDPEAWQGALSVPEYVHLTRHEIARALGITNNPTDPITQDRSA